jgi:predicted SAM-dependent methyltransferase
MTLLKGRSKGQTMSEITKVHIGCGPSARLEGWWNTDLRPFEGIDQALDAVKPWPWRNCLTHVYAEHFLEHLGIDQAIAFLTHAGDALREGGRLRLSTPNLTWVMATHYTLGSAVDHQTRRMQTLRINRAFHGWGHQFLWSEDMLVGLMASMGYQHVETFAYGESRDPALQAIERHGGYLIDNGLSNVIIVEAVRGSRPIALDEGMKALIDREFLSHVQAGH